MLGNYVTMWALAEILSYLARHRSEWIGCHAATSNGISSNWQCLCLCRYLCLALLAQVKVKANGKAKRRKCQWYNDNDNYNDSEHNAKGRTSWRVNHNPCGPMRKPKSFASFTCSVLPLGMCVLVCVHTCTSCRDSSAYFENLKRHRKSNAREKRTKGQDMYVHADAPSQIA